MVPCNQRQEECLQDGISHCDISPQCRVAPFSARRKMPIDLKHLEAPRVRTDRDASRWLQCRRTLESEPKSGDLDNLTNREYALTALTDVNRTPTRNEFRIALDVRDKIVDPSTIEGEC